MAECRRFRCVAAVDRRASGLESPAIVDCVCEALEWRTAGGQLKDMSARLLLNKLA